MLYVGDDWPLSSKITLIGSTRDHGMSEWASESQDAMPKRTRMHRV